MKQLHTKKVIFVGGTSYSGSTFLDMVLANSQDAFSCGEVNALFYPYRRHHLNPECGCGNPACNVWRIVKQGGVKQLYQTIFELYPEINIIVDSSKDPLWIRNRSKDLKEACIAVENVLIWKSPEEFFASRSKRGQSKGWQQEWINYHRYYFSLVDNWISLPYEQLARTADTLEQLCGQLGIPYFEGKEEYWYKIHHTLFGNTSAKIHLYDKKSSNFRRCQNELNSTIEGGGSENITHKAVYYSSSAASDEALKLRPITKKIKSILTESSLSNAKDFSKDKKLRLNRLKMGWMYDMYRKLKSSSSGLI